MSLNKKQQQQQQPFEKSNDLAVLNHQPYSDMTGIVWNAALAGCSAPDPQIPAAPPCLTPGRLSLLHLPV